ncbi:hypothetical protein GQ44DRAFT_739954 [Phaeosphaeriaceae sp. PMI808]|nr:hypothetical protein GQ44DRAFT_739954 [Phaeosphaeriaceae sp. PMI808]
MVLFNNETALNDKLRASESYYNFLSEDELEYMSLIQHQIQPFYPKFSVAIAEQTASLREQGRCTMVDFTPDGQHITTFANSEELVNSFTDTQPPPYHVLDQLPRRRLFILEDLPCNHILALGSRLRVPPSFFAGHWEDPASSTFNHRNPFQRSPLPNFRLRYATSFRVEVDMPPLPDGRGMSNFAFNTNVCRYLHTYNAKGLLYDEARSHHIMSFWASNPREDGSWDAVLLVDPPPANSVRCLSSKNSIPLRKRLHDETLMPKHFLNPELDSPHELPSDSSTWATSYMKTPQYVSIYDDILEAYCSSKVIKATKDPLTCVEIPRKLVMSTLLAFVRRRYLNIVKVQQGQMGPSSMRHNYLYSFSNSSMATWSNEFFDFMIGSCAAMREFAREMHENMIALGLDSTSAAPGWECDGWKSIRDITHVVEEMTKKFSENYLQYVSIQEAHHSNGSAQSLSRITVLTMLFIPLSTIASIFSMGGDFLPGETKAWIFWIVAIPVLVVLAYIYCKSLDQYILPIIPDWTVTW